MIVAVRASLLTCVQFKDNWLDDTALGTDTFLTTLGYSPTEITTIRASFSAMKSLSNIAKAAGTQPSANDFYFDAKKLIGLNV